MKESWYLTVSDEYDYIYKFQEDLHKRNISEWDELNQSDKYIVKKAYMQMKQDIEEALELIGKWEEEVYGIIEENIVFQ